MNYDDAGSAPKADAGSTSGPTEPAPVARHARQGRDGRRGKRAGFRAWRRSRPFWGGFLLLLAGLEILAIPLSGVLVKGQVKLVIYIGIGGVFGVLIGALLIVAGIVAWVNPTHRVFYGIAGIVLGILSFPASNLGGFFLGMLLAIVGGAMAFAWTPTPTPASRLPFPPDTGTAPAQRTLALAVMPAMLVAGLTGAAQNTAAASSGDCILFGLICQPASSASPSASPSSTGTGTGTGTSPSPSPSPSGLLPSLGLPGASGGASPSASASPSPSASVPVSHAAAPSSLTGATATSVLTAGSARLTKLNFAGIVSLPVSGGTEQALELTADSAAMSGVNIAVTQGDATVNTKSTSLGFPDGMTLYTTKMCGQVYGVLPDICFTPSTISQVLLQLASVLGKATPITMTNVTTDQFLVSADTMRWGTLSMGS